MTTMVAAGGLATIIYLLCSVVGIAVRVCLAIAIYYDAQSKNLKNTTLYAVLSAFFPLVVGIIYAATRNSAAKEDKVCSRCNQVVNGAMSACPYCYNTTFFVRQVPNEQELNKKSKKIFIAAAVMYGVTIIAFALTYTLLAVGLINSTKPSTYDDYDKSYNDYVDDYDDYDDYDYDDYDYDSDSDSDYDYDYGYEDYDDYL